MNRLIKDLVCGTIIRNSKAVATYRYKGKIFYFCSAKCLNKFSKKPSHYLSKRRHRKLPPRMKVRINGMKGFHPYSASVTSRAH
jgi:YHS domain-containing protein